MIRMIERWFPSAEVSANSDRGWGSGNAERNLFTWFAARPVAQAKAAVVCSLLPWPDDEAEQRRLQDLVREAMTGRYAAWDEIRQRILEANPDGASVLDPFSGRAMIPLEAARLGLPSFAIDYSPVATLAGHLLADYPFRDWSDEPPLPFKGVGRNFHDDRPRLVRDVEAVLDEVGRRWSASVREFYPKVSYRQPWGYLWAVTLPCQECGHRFPLVGAYKLRQASYRRDPASRTRFWDPGQSYYVSGDLESGEFYVVVHEGDPQRTPVLSNFVDANGRRIPGKTAVCVHCGHAHPVATHKRLASEGLGRDALLLVADVDPILGKTYRTPTDEELEAARKASEALSEQPSFSPLLSAVPDEEIPPRMGALIRPQLYGAETYGDLMCDRQTLATARLARCIDELLGTLTSAGLSIDYAQALCAYAAAVLTRKLRRSTRGCTLDARLSKIHDVYANQGTISYAYDFFESGIGTGPGTWNSLARSTVSTLESLMEDLHGRPTEVSLGSAVSLPMRGGSVDVVVTDPPYDSLIYYSDSSDYLYAWIKRALASSFPELGITSDPRGLQGKQEEIIVWDHGRREEEHRDRAHYDTHIARAFKEMRRVVGDDGLVTIVFGHGDPEVWQRLLGAIEAADLVMTASWPANTEAGGAHGGMASIETTLTMACRPAPPQRNPGRKGVVEAEIKEEVKRRYADWERWQLAPADMLMAAAGPAMEVVGRYSEIRNVRGEPVDIYTFLPLARAAVQEAMAVEVDHHPLDAFDARTRFGLWWVRLYGRQVQARSELRWQSLAASMDLNDVRDLIPNKGKGVSFTTAKQFESHITNESAAIDVALALAKASDDSVDRMGEVLAASGRGAEDVYLWATVKFLAQRLPDSDPDAIALSRVLRARNGIHSASERIVTREEHERRIRTEDRQMKLL